MQFAIKIVDKVLEGRGLLNRAVYAEIRKLFSFLIFRGLWVSASPVGLLGQTWYSLLGSRRSCEKAHVTG